MFQVTIISVACLAALAISAPVPEADPEAFIDLGAVALPAITGSALIDGLLLGKVAFLKGKLLPYQITVVNQMERYHFII